MPDVELAFDPSLVAYCGFYCGGCPTFLSGDCEGCLASHGPGDCYTADCVPARGLRLCGACEQFPCDPIMELPRATVLDPRWLAWKRRAQRMDAWLRDLLIDGSDLPGDPGDESTRDGEGHGGDGEPFGGDGRNDAGDSPGPGRAS